MKKRFVAAIAILAAAFFAHGATFKSQKDKTGENAIKITVGDVVLDGAIYDVPLAREIAEKFPFTIFMKDYGGREYYGNLNFYPKNKGGGQKKFENGDVAYCEAYRSLTIFYSQSENPNLSVEIIPIGKITSDLSIFDTFGSEEKFVFSLGDVLPKK